MSMSTQFEPILTRNIGVPNSETIRVYLAHLRSSRAEILEMAEQPVHLVQRHGALVGAAERRRDQPLLA